MQIKPLSKKEIAALRFIRNTLVKSGKAPSIRDIMESLHFNYPRSAAFLINKLISKGILKRKIDGDLQILEDPTAEEFNARTVDVPLVGSVACGTPTFAEENFEMMIPVSTRLAKAPHKYFILRADGDSMNKKNINDGDMVLVRQQWSANEGDSIVALVDDEATIKELHFSSGAIVLKPQSKNTKHKPIILTDDFKIQGKIIATIKNV